VSRACDRRSFAIVASGREASSADVAGILATTVADRRIVPLGGRFEPLRKKIFRGVHPPLGRRAASSRRVARVVATRVMQLICNAFVIGARATSKSANPRRSYVSGLSCGA